jgi:hypothetical protein
MTTWLEVSHCQVILKVVMWQGRSRQHCPAAATVDVQIAVKQLQLLNQRDQLQTAGEQGKLFWTSRNKQERKSWQTMKTAMTGIVQGKIIELAEEPGLPDGQEVNTTETPGDAVPS